MPPESLPLDPASPAVTAYCCFRSLVSAFSKSCEDETQGLGGKLLYGGELDREGRAVVLAGNVAGCATLAASADLDAQKQAIRDGVVDFLVTTLSEALRILKNEVRKRGTVAVCVSQPPAEVAGQMIERGVQPDFAREQAEASKPASLIGEFSGIDSMRPLATVAWGVEKSPARWLPLLDRVALECLEPSDGWNRRWLRLSPRYLGRLAPGIRLLSASPDFARNLVERLQARYQRGDIEVEAWIGVSAQAGFDKHILLPTRGH